MFIKRATNKYTSTKKPVCQKLLMMASPVDSKTSYIFCWKDIVIGFSTGSKIAEFLQVLLLNVADYLMPALPAEMKNH